MLGSGGGIGRYSSDASMTCRELLDELNSSVIDPSQLREWMIPDGALVFFFPGHSFESRVFLAP